MNKKSVAIYETLALISLALSWSAEGDSKKIDYVNLIMQTWKFHRNYLALLIFTYCFINWNVLGGCRLFSEIVRLILFPHQHFTVNQSKTRQNFKL